MGPSLKTLLLMRKSFFIINPILSFLFIIEHIYQNSMNKRIIFYYFFNRQIIYICIRLHIISTIFFLVICNIFLYN
ncbi:hypothetical protein Plano_0714 [Planococcus sp. PAMC 21323]|nr:hypothetical protein Plano_0714 [Planococcus sp. PAMC 21323]